MPDDDRLPRSLSARWRRVLKAFQAGEPQEAIEHHVAKAAAETLRRAHGVPELPTLGAQAYLAAVADHGGDGSRREPSAQIPTRLARQAVDALSAAMIWPVTRLRACLDDPEPWRRMVSEFPELTSVTGLTQQEVVRLYRAYVEEWGSNEDAVRLHARRESRTVALCLMTSKTRSDNPRR